MASQQSPWSATFPGPISENLPKPPGEPVDVSFNPGVLAGMHQLGMSKFMLALDSIISSIPGINLEAKHTTLVDGLFKNKQFMQSMFDTSLLVSSTVAELVDKEKHPRLYSGISFLRNVLALEKIRRQVKEKIVIRAGTNMDEWNKIVELFQRENPADKITYVPPGLDTAGSIITTVGCNPVSASTFYAMYRCDADHTVTRLNAVNGTYSFNLGGRKSFSAESLYRYGPEIQRVFDTNGSMKFILAKATTGFSWLQVFKITQLDGDGQPDKFASPFYLVPYMSNFFTNGSSQPTVSIPDLNFVQILLIDKAGTSDMISMDAFIERRRSATLHVANALLKKMKFSMFDPETSVIQVSTSQGADSSSNAIMFTRITQYSGKGAVHVLSEYDTIRDALGKCMKVGKSRGYAFVGAPGTGKTIMMNQLVNEFPSVPVIKFSMQGMQTIEDLGNGTMLQSILDIVQSLTDAGFDKVFLCCDDIDSVDMSTKNSPVENLINLLDGLHFRLEKTASIIFMCTVNDPTKMHSTIIKRGKRIDEVIEVPCPDSAAIRRLINSVKDKDDPTDYTDARFAELIDRMAAHRFSLADLSTMMTNLQIYGSPGDDGKFTPETLATAIERLETSKANATKTYDV